MISPTLACVDYLALKEQIKQMDDAKVDFYHIDMMDGNYVPNLCLNYDFIKAVRSISNTPMDVHIMAVNPYDYLNRLSEIGVEYISTHVDCVDNIEKWIDTVHEKNAKAGVVLNIEDGIENIKNYLDKLDLVLLMAVKPGFSGQKFNGEVLEKAKELSQLKKSNGYNYIIEIDGGISWDNITECKNAGVELAVAGVFAVFNQEKSVYESCVNFKKLA